MVWRAFSAPVGSWKISWADAAVLAQRPTGVPERLPAHPHLARVRALEPDDRAGERSLPAARLAHERQDLAAAHLEVDPVDGAGVPVACGELHV